MQVIKKQRKKHSIGFNKLLCVRSTECYKDW